MISGIRTTIAGLVLGANNKRLLFGNASVAATGTNQATAAPLPATSNTVTAADGTKAVLLPAIAAAGQRVSVYNAVATNGLPVFPTSTNTINNGTGAAAVTIEGYSLAIFEATSTTNWGAIFTTNT
jgi:hypothetical protein